MQDSINALLAKFEKSELYTFLVGCTVSLSYLLKHIFNNDYSALQGYYYQIFLFIFLFLVFTGITYLVYQIVIMVISIIIQVVLSEKHVLGRHLTKKLCSAAKKAPVRYLPALNMYVELRHVILLITCGLLLLLPNIEFVLKTYLDSQNLIYGYYFLLMAGTCLSAYVLYVLIVFDLCQRKGCFQITDNQEEFVKALNEIAEKG